MRGLEVIASKIAERLVEEGRIDSEGHLIEDEATAAILNDYPVWVLSYHATSLRAFFICQTMAEKLDVPANFIAQENEYLTVHHCDAATSLHRFKAYEYFHAGNQRPLINFATIFLPDGQTVNCHDVAAPLSLTPEGKVLSYTHLYAPLDSLTLAHAYSFCDPGELTARQREVFTELLKGKRPRTIAENLRISEKTLEKHLRAVLQHTGHTHPSALVATASSFN
ncbi:MAG: LuxR C-terminal-related transcriptional regulator [Verrucomicrobiota bacterium JB023]|nr:LuxR C-terminal-related transcriptional regulator [Verrucomicrobiota bacterium JB023]